MIILCLVYGTRAVDALRRGCAACFWQALDTLLLGTIVLALMRGLS